MYTIGDFLIQLKNAYRAQKKQMEYPYSNAIFSIGKILEKEKYVSKLKVKINKSKLGTEFKILEIELKYSGKMPAIADINLISKPSVHQYIGKNQIRKAVPRNSTGIISTNKGIMTSKEAQKAQIGGELICQIY